MQSDQQVAWQGVHFQGRLPRRRTWFVRTGLHHFSRLQHQGSRNPAACGSRAICSFLQRLQQTAQKRIETPSGCSMFGVRVEQAFLCPSSSLIDEAQAFRSSQAPPLRPQGTVMCAPAKACSFPHGSSHSSETRVPRLASGTRQRERYGIRPRPAGAPSSKPSVPAALEHQQQCGSR